VPERVNEAQQSRETYPVKRCPIKNMPGGGAHKRKEGETPRDKKNRVEEETHKW